MTNLDDAATIHTLNQTLTNTQRALVAAYAQAPPDPIDPAHTTLCTATRQLLIAHGVLDGDGYLTPFGVRAGLAFAQAERS